MKTLSKSLIILLVLSLTLFAQDFRKSKWGDSPSQIKSAEKEGTLLPELCDENSIVYRNIEVGGLSVVVSYQFINNKLVRGVYVFIDEHYEKNEYLYDMSKIGVLLAEKYGETDAEVNWKNKLYADDPSHYGMAIGLGHVTLRYEWTTPRTIISHELFGGDFEVSHRLVYESSQSYGDWDEFMTKKKSKGL